ncbi:hypothetical protein AMK59_6354 [Oryctes borbonicus]|uniref:Alpha-and gamma-adaptin-binding protein p34 n=1 Tax=Oryctes borbonicus TaxID=1629725 RepID=A0A0T6B0V0_9SCAR|nr:hypothetical protein AMK59_6354 [Oryctes borbonicus]
MTDIKPSVLIVSNCTKEPKFLLELIAKSSEIKQDGSHKFSYSWTIDTKYYTANVDLFAITDHYERDEDFNETVKALIIHTDCNIETGLTSLNKWEGIESDCDLEIKLLVADYCDDESKISLKEATEWSRKRGFEFIVLNSTIENDENEEIIKEKVGVDRIIEALQTCIWPNLQMKEACTPGYNNLEKLSLHQNEEDFDKLIDEVLLDEGMDEFTELFGQLHTMKESIQSLSGSERKQCAEQMVTAFWKAIGGDDDELQDS